MWLFNCLTPSYHTVQTGRSAARVFSMKDHFDAEEEEKDPVLFW